MQHTVSQLTPRTIKGGVSFAILGTKNTIVVGKYLNGGGQKRLLELW